MEIISRKRVRNLIDNAKESTTDIKVLDYPEFNKIIKSNTDKLDINYDYYKSKSISYHCENYEIHRLLSNTYINYDKYPEISIKPDGFNENGELIDILPINNHNGDIILNNIADDYYMYIQFILHICNINKCKIYIYHYSEFNNSKTLKKKRKNKEYYGCILNDKQSEHGQVYQASAAGSNSKACDKEIFWMLGYIQELIIDRDYTNFRNNFDLVYQKIKSNLPINDFKSKKRPKFENEYLGKDWISASKTRNAALNDHCLDYFRAYNVLDVNDTPTKRQYTLEQSSRVERINKKPEESDTFIDYLLTSGNVFEDNIVNQLEKKFPNKIVMITDSWNARDVSNYHKTIEVMKKGIPIIYQAILYNYENKIFGSADLLVRSDWLNKIVNLPVISDDDAKIRGSKLGQVDYHYRVIDIKFSKMHMNVDGETLRNNHNVKPFKCQVNIYNRALGEMQGYTPDTGYILGKGWIYTKKIDKINNTFENRDPFNKLGKINFSDLDNHYNQIADDAIEWLKELNNSVDWTHNPPSNKYIYPNMCNNLDGIYNKVKNQIAEKYSDITLVWQCGTTNRDNAFNNNVYKWTDDDCNSYTLGITGEKTKSCVDALLHFNRDKSSRLVSPDKIITNYKNWQNKNKLSLFVDFETIGEMLLISNKDSNLHTNGDFIFMIGLGWQLPNDNKWYYKNYTCNTINIREEECIIDNFISHMLDLIDEHDEDYKLINVYHWGHVERTIFEKINKRHNFKWIVPNWFDFLEVFRNNLIIVKGALNFGLKTVAKAMYKNDLIKTTWDNNSICSNGNDAMFHAWKTYININNNVVNTKVMKDIIYYNEIDCKMVFEIINYLRNNHC